MLQTLQLPFLQFLELLAKTRLGSVCYFVAHLLWLYFPSPDGRTLFGLGLATAFVSVSLSVVAFLWLRLG